MKQLLLCIAMAMLALPCSGFAQSTNPSALRSVGIALEYDSATSFTVEAGTAIEFNLVARDENLNVVEDWDQIGRDVMLTVRGSHAETDTSMRSWNGDPLAYSWLAILINAEAISLDSLAFRGAEALLFYSIPNAAFSKGRASLSFAQSRADSAVRLSIAPAWNFLRQESPPITMMPAEHDNYLVDLTRSLPDLDAVYLLRLYEFVVTPRDRYLNPISAYSVQSEFTARYPGEFDNIPGVTPNLGSSMDITGETPLYLASRIPRGESHGTALQWVRVYSSQSNLVMGQTNPYAVLDHAPNPFALLQPSDEAEIEIQSPRDKESFTWTKATPQDPYTDIQISRFDPTLFSDDVTYKIRFLDASSLTRAIEFDSDSNGVDTTFTITHEQLSEIIIQISGIPTTKEQELIWYVEATDGLYVTESAPPNTDSQNRDGYRLTLSHGCVFDIKPVVGKLSFALQPNYPNPFNPSTTIMFEMRESGAVRLRVRNLLGEDIATLHDGFLAAGEHRFHFHGDGLPSGVYSYQLEMDGSTITRQMVLLR